MSLIIINNEADLINYLEELKNTTFSWAEFLMKAKLLEKTTLDKSTLEQERWNV